MPRRTSSTRPPDEPLGAEHVADVLDEIAVFLELTGENPFRARAYTNAARELRSAEEPLAKLVAEDRLGELRGFGAGMIEKVKELVTTGQSPYYDDLRAKVPGGLLEMLRIPGLGAKRIQLVHLKLGIDSVGDLETACKENRVAAL